MPAQGRHRSSALPPPAAPWGRRIVFPAASSREGRCDTGGGDGAASSQRPDDRGIRFRCGRRYPGGPQDLQRARSVRFDGHHGDHRSEHGRCHCRPRDPDGYRGGPARRRDGGYRCGCGEDRHVEFGCDHRDGRRRCPATPDRAAGGRSGDGRQERRPPAPRRRGHGAARDAATPRLHRHAECTGGRGAVWAAGTQRGGDAGGGAHHPFVRPSIRRREGWPRRGR
ncbi:hypothetical protein HRbin27_01897 [bacterium HR27]|nr:hypothetical protein HRbin27_01897 [bacterium HR27]